MKRYIVITTCRKKEEFVHVLDTKSLAFDIQSLFNHASIFEGQKVVKIESCDYRKSSL